MSNGKKLSILHKVLLFVGIFVVVALITSQRGGLGFFSPHTLEYRTQSEQTIFAIGVPFYRSSFTYVDHPLIAMLVKDGFLTPQPDRTDRWICIFHWNKNWKDGYGTLYNVLNRDGKEVLEWTRRNPECAKILWSEGFRHLRSNDPNEIRIGEAILYEGWRIFDRIDAPDDMRKIIQRIVSENKL